MRCLISADTVERCYFRLHSPDNDNNNNSNAATIPYHVDSSRKSFRHRLMTACTVYTVHCTRHFIYSYTHLYYIFSLSFCLLIMNFVKWNCNFPSENINPSLHCAQRARRHRLQFYIDKASVLTTAIVLAFVPTTSRTSPSKNIHCVRILPTASFKFKGDEKTKTYFRSSTVLKQWIWVNTRLVAQSTHQVHNNTYTQNVFKWMENDFSLYWTVRRKNHCSFH